MYTKVVAEVIAAYLKFIIHMFVMNLQQGVMPE